MHLHTTSLEIGVNARIIRTDAQPDVLPEIIMSLPLRTIVSKSINKAATEGHHFRGREGKKKAKGVRAAYAPVAFVGHLFSEVTSDNSLQTACL